MPSLADLDVTLPDRATVVAAALAAGERSIREPRHRAMFAAAIAFDHNEPDVLSLGRDLASAAYCASTGSTVAPLALATLNYVLWTALDVLDDIADGDAATKWPAYGAGELNVMAVSLVAATAHELAAGLSDDPAVQARLHLRLARGFREMADGQIADLADTGRNDLTSDRVAAAVAGKTGAECALFVALGATLAGVPADRLAAYETFGTAYGMANQYATDLSELFGDGVCRDLVNGTRTLPIVLHLERLAGAERDAFLRTLAYARHDPDAAAAVRASIATGPSLRATVLQILIHVQQARSALVLAEPLAPGAAVLERFLLEIDPLR
jgi:geranylgeranyl pyrophosphate synthase